MALKDYRSRVDLFDHMKTIDKCPSCGKYGFLLQNEAVAVGTVHRDAGGLNPQMTIIERIDVYYVECVECHTILATCAERKAVVGEITKEMKGFENKDEAPADNS